MPPIRDAPEEVKERCVQQVREELAEYLHPRWNTKWNILRWLQDFDYDTDKTIDWLRKHLKYRRERRLDEDMGGLMRCASAEEFCPITIVGPNRKEGGTRLLVFEQPGRVDVNGMMNSTQPTQFLHHMFRGIEGAMRTLNEMEEKVGDQCYVQYIFDMDGLQFHPSMLKIATGPFRQAWELVGVNYREFIDKFIVVNAPVYVNLFYHALWPFVPPRHRNRIHICGKNWKEYLLQGESSRSNLPDHYLLQIADKECLPERYGGTIPNKDVMHYPIPVPKDRYWKLPDGYPQPHQLHKLTVPAGKTRCVILYMKAWTTMGAFSMGDSETTLSLFYAPTEEELVREYTAIPDTFPELVLPTATITPVPCMDYFDYVAERAGYYMIKIKNESTWIFPLHAKLRLFDHNGEEIPMLNSHEKWIKLNKEPLTVKPPIIIEYAKQKATEAKEQLSHSSTSQPQI